MKKEDKIRREVKKKKEILNEKKIEWKITIMMNGQRKLQKETQKK